MSLDLERNNLNNDRLITTSLTSTNKTMLSSLINQNNNYLKGLILILKFSGLYPFYYPISLYFTLFIIIVMWITVVAVIINVFLFPSSQYFYHQVGNVIWMIHSAAIYSIVGYDMIFLNGRLLIFMNSISCGDSNQSFTLSISLPESYCNNLTKVGWFTTIAVFLGVIGNLITVGYFYLSSNGLYVALHVTKSIWFDILGICLWYFFSYGWVLSLPYACIPAYALNCRIEMFISYLQSLSKEISRSSYEPSYPLLSTQLSLELLQSSTSQQSLSTNPLTSQQSSPTSSISFQGKPLEVTRTILPFDKILDWYGDLYLANKLLIMNVSVLLTVDILLCSILSVFLLHSFVLAELNQDIAFAGYVWLIINTLFVFTVSCSIAFIYGKNAKIIEILGSMRSKYQCIGNNPTLFQFVICKFSSIPLGVPFFGTKQYITFQMIAKVMTLVSSFYLFIASINTK